MKSIRLKHKVKINFKNPNHDICRLNQSLVCLIKSISLIIYPYYQHMVTFYNRECISEPPWRNLQKRILSIFFLSMFSKPRAAIIILLFQYCKVKLRNILRLVLYKQPHRIECSSSFHDDHTRFYITKVCTNQNDPVHQIGVYFV